MTYAHATEVALLRQELANWLAEQAAEEEPPSEEDRDAPYEQAP